MSIKLSGEYRIAEVDRPVNADRTVEGRCFQIQLWEKKPFKKGKWLIMSRGIYQRHENGSYYFEEFPTYEAAEIFLYEMYVEKKRTVKIGCHYEYERISFGWA